jgi:hypothetical protein
MKILLKGKLTVKFARNGKGGVREKQMEVAG